MKCSLNRPVLWTAFLLIILLIANIWVFLKRDWEQSYYPTSYATLYYPLDVPSIKNWKIIDRDVLELNITWSGQAEKWQLFIDDVPTEIIYGTKPRIKLNGDELEYKKYTLKPLPEGNGPNLDFDIRFISKEYYAERGMKRNDVYTITSDVPYGSFKQYPVSYWLDDYAYVGEENLKKADDIICNEMGILPSDPTFTKMEKLSKYLRIALKNARGVPKDDFRWMNPWLIYQEMVNGTGKGWCTQHAQIYTFFANRAGIPTRYLFGANTQDNTITYTGHSWAESYIKEQNRWTFVDLAHSHIYITDRNGLVLNTADLFHLNQYNAFDSTFARIYKDWEWEKLDIDTGKDSIVTVPLSWCNRVVKGQLVKNAIIKYRRTPNCEEIRNIYSMLLKDNAFFWSNVKTYLFKPPLAYSFMPTEGKKTYFIRQSLFFSMTAVFLLLCITIVCRSKK